MSPQALRWHRSTAGRFITAAELRAAPDKKLARAAGIVTHRQRPGTSSGIVFVTMEDAHQHQRPERVEKQRRETLAARLLGVYGQLESRHGVTPSGGQAAGGYDTATGTAGDAESGFSLGQYRSGADLGWCAA